MATEKEISFEELTEKYEKEIIRLNAQLKKCNEAGRNISRRWSNTYEELRTTLSGVHIKNNKLQKQKKELKAQLKSREIRLGAATQIITNLQFLNAELKGKVLKPEQWKLIKDNLECFISQLWDCNCEDCTKARKPWKELLKKLESKL